MVKFERPVGAHADLRELEYVSALHQSQDGPAREDGSIRDVDIQRFLLSRHAIDVPLLEVRRTILGGLAGGEDEDETLDLAELIAVLLIPTLVKAAMKEEVVESVKEEEEEDQALVGAANEKEEEETFDDDGNRRKQDKDRTLPSCVSPPEAGLIREVLSMILRDVTGDDTPKPLTMDLMRDILLAYGEDNMADDEELLMEMVTAASAGGVGANAGKESNSSSGASPMFGVDCFSRALKSDVSLYDVASETRHTTVYHDVLTSGKDKNKDNTNDEEEEMRKNTVRTEPSDRWSNNDADTSDTNHNRQSNIETELSNKDGDAKIQRVGFFSNLPSIDFAADRYRSKTVATLLWLGFGLMYFTYFAPSIQYILRPGIACIQNANDEDKDPSFGCKVANSIVGWLVILALLVGWGVGYVGLGSIGNDVESTRRWPVIIGMCMTAPFALMFFIIFNYGQTSPNNDNDDDSDEEERNEARSYELYLYIVTLVIGYVIVLNQFMLLLDINWARRRISKWCFTPGIVRAESDTKRAAAHKLNNLVKNALQIHRLENTMGIGTSFGKGLVNFTAAEGQTHETAGGYLWVWSRIYSGELFKKEGIWISSRVLAGNIGQVFLSIFLLVWGSYLTSYAVKRWREGLVEDDAYVDAFLSFLNIDLDKEAIAGRAVSAYFDIVGDIADYTLVALNAIDETVATVVNDTYPQEEYMIVIPMTVAILVAFGLSLAVSTVYIPSWVSTALQFRTGLIPVFRENYRTRLDHITMLLGSMLWGAFYSSALLGIITGAIVFLLLWQVTRVYLVWILAEIIGLSITFLIKVMLVWFFLVTMYTGFYRKHVGRANIASLCFEFANIAFAVLTALTRAFQLICLTAMYIGRFDTPFLAEGVGVGPLRDIYPDIFRQDLLLHEAHRHPYMEVLGAMYMMKLRHGKAFGSRAGYCYRLIFTIALMPWLRKYRIMARPELLLLGDDMGGINAADKRSCDGEATITDSARINNMRDTLRRSSGVMASIVGNLRMKDSLHVAVSQTQARDDDADAVVPTITDSSDDGL